ncbi:3-carboxy-cis,cis-muconate cycloisomerase [Spirosoma sp. KCTC 42546]|uniref:3-carboxy-cis,cis-muconate cycloisomerase n=1 Tax=Spirosoma sp. KCTC 42546 TaxID=2520506 RepID=UPI00115ABCCD|nr:3-carboxy-cis,cis-muconate cycloisomerase [Spirosoma sp. KCTC 42546]QDK77210.1 3-carboxy-cis,cis-muconate cycloisomerase [Spirosoma sp. KCTC 42546]
MSLYTYLFYSADGQSLLSDDATLAHMLQFEGALAQAQAKNGLVPVASAEMIVACCQADLLDVDRLKRDSSLSGNAAIPLVKQLTVLVRQRDEEAAKFVHLGATSQDLVDTATVLTIKQFIDWLDGKLSALENSLVRLTKQYRRTVMIGRTLLQQAKPITFGLKTALWLEGIGRSRQRLTDVKKRVLVLQLAGAAGSRNRSISAEVHENLATQLGLRPSVSWHTQRDNLAEFASVLGILTGSLGKIAKDVSLLMQTEIAEVLEGKAEGKGGSSTMPHKRNPVTSTAILANANRVPNLVATLLAAMPQEHERSAGLWHSEWEVQTEIMQLTAGTVERSLELLNNLDVDEQRMRQNLELTNGLIYAETVSLALAPNLGKAQAHELVEKACSLAVSQKKYLKDVLLEQHLDLSDLDELFKPENAIGQSLDIIDSILTHYDPQL